jgi:hypothetical protein
MAAKRIGRPAGLTKTKKSVTIDNDVLEQAEERVARSKGKLSLSSLVETALQNFLTASEALPTGAASPFTGPAPAPFTAPATAAAAARLIPRARPLGKKIIPLTLPASTPAASTPAASAVAEEPAIIPLPATRSHIMAAAGPPITAEVTDWDGADDTVLVRISGLSMSPRLNDGDVVAMRHKKISRSPHMKKGLIYLVEYDGGYTVKRYNTRKPTPDEQGEEWVENGKVKTLQSLNPTFPEIIIKQPLDWIAWLDEK